MSPQPDEQKILESIRRIVRALRLSSRAAQKRVGLSGAQVFVLQKLSEESPTSLNGLAERTFTDQSSVSVVVSRLVADGLIEKRKALDDARRLELSLTKKGSLFLRKAQIDLAQERLIEAIESMDPAVRGRLAKDLVWIVEKAGFAGEEPSLFFEDEKEKKGK